VVAPNYDRHALRRLITRRELPVPARIVVVYADTEFSEELATRLRTEGHDVATFPDPLAAWDALEAAKLTEVLVTRVEFPPGRSNGVSLALMARSKRPGIRVLFLALPKYAEAIEGVGTLLALPVSVEEAAEAVKRLLISEPHR
jgi:DNA-binding NtrC family response regulator